MDDEEQHKQDAPRQAVRVKQGEQGALEDAFGVNGDAFKEVGKRYPEKQGGQKAAQEETSIPQAPPAGIIHLAPEGNGDAP